MTRVASPRAVAAAVVDPEIPVITIDDLGILRDVTEHDGSVEVVITPTYSGCPAMAQINDDIVTALTDAGYVDVTVRTVLSPAWSTDWISSEGRRKLEEYGIAPPGPAPAPVAIIGRLAELAASSAPASGSDHAVLCPRCRSAETRTVSEFGSTACKSLMVCSSCAEPFDRFKEL